MDHAIQLDRADYSALSAAPEITCASCRSPIADVYYQANSALLCFRCSEDASRAVGGGFSSRGIRFARATFFGAIAGAVGAGLYYAVLAITGYQLGLIAILVGLMVGKAVNAGSRGRGGWRYQLLAMFLTYLAMASTFVPLVIKAARAETFSQVAASELDQVADDEHVSPAGDRPSPAHIPTKAEVAAAAAAAQPKQVDPLNGYLLHHAAVTRRSTGLMLLFMMCSGLALGVLSLPILVGMSNPMTFLIIGFGVFEAWKLNKRVDLEVSGPHQILRNQIQPSPLG